MPGDKDKWNSFETYKGPPERELPGWVDRLCKVFFGIVGLGLAFGVGGALLWLLAYRFGTASTQFALAEESWISWARFVIGGIAGVVVAICWWRRLKMMR